MAIIINGVVCPICGKPIDTKQDYFASTAFLDPEHPLHRYSDRAMHWECYLGWPSRQEFARVYLNAVKRDEKTNPFWHLIFDGDRILVRYGEIGQLDVLLKLIASHVRIGIEELDEWLKGPKVKSRYVQAETDRSESELSRLCGKQHIESLLAAQRSLIVEKKRAADIS